MVCQIYTADDKERKFLKPFIYACVGIILLITACGRKAEADPPPPMPPVITTPTAVASTLAALTDAELLGAPGVTTACDHPPEAHLTCTEQAGAPPRSMLTVQVNASTYARWSLRFDRAETALTGDEILSIATVQTGALKPNLYLVERSGRRVPVSLARYGLQVGENHLYIPLREIRDEAGEWPAFADVNEIQLVFEWADMAGELTVQSLQFLSVWQEPIQLAARSRELAANLELPAGFTATAIADSVRETTQLKFDSAGNLWVSLQSGRIWRYHDTTGNGIYDERLLYATGFEEVVGLLYDPTNGAVWVGGRGKLYHTVDTDGNGVADERHLRLDGLPWGRHQNNGLAWNPDPDPFTGEAGLHWLYFGLGSTDDLDVGGELNATVLRFPREGNGQADLEIVSHGNRNAYDVVWAPVPVDLAQPDGPTAWQLFASENGPDFNDAPDEVNHIRWQHHYGFPNQFGPVAADASDGEPYSGPVYPVTAHASADGLAYITNPGWPPAYQTLYVALFGQVFSPDPVGHTVEGVTLTTVETATGTTYRGEPFTFVAGLDRPLPLTTAPDGNLVVGDYATGVIYKISYRGE